METPKYANLTKYLTEQWSKLTPAKDGIWHVQGCQLLRLAYFDSNNRPIDEDLWYEVSEKGIFPLSF